MGRVGLLRGYGNAIVPQAAAAFVSAFMECFDEEIERYDIPMKKQAYDQEWKTVVHSCECDEDGNCPNCEIDFAECDCPGPTQDGYEYEERPEGMFARRLPQ